MESAALFKRIFSYGSINAITIAAMFVFHVVAGRFLGATDYGKLSFALTFCAMLLPLLDPGLYYLTIRETARNLEAAKNYLSHGLTWRLISAPFFILIVLATAAVVQDSSEALFAVALVAIGQVFLAAKDGIRATLQGLEKFYLDGASLAFDRFGLLIVSSAVLLSGGGLVAVCWAYLALRVADFCVALGLVSGHVAVKLGLDFQYLFSILKRALPIGAFYLTLNIYSYVDVFMLTAYRGNEEVGWYSAAYRLYEGPMLIPTIIGAVFMPLLSRLFVQDRNDYVRKLSQGVVYVFLASLVVAGVGISIAAWLIGLSFGPEYGNSVLALKILLVGAPFIFVINFLQTALIAIDQQRIVLFVALAGLVANVSLNLVLIPREGYLGAAVATVIAEFLACVALSVLIRRTVRAPQFRNPPPAELGE